MTSRSRLMVQMALEKFERERKTTQRTENVLENKQKVLDKFNDNEKCDSNSKIETDSKCEESKITSKNKPNNTSKVCEKVDNTNGNGSERVNLQREIDVERVKATNEINKECEQVNNKKIYDKRNENDDNVPEGLELQTENTDSDESTFGKDSDFYDSDNSATDKTWMPNKRNGDFVSDSDDSETSYQTFRKNKKKKKGKKKIHHDINNNDPHVSQSNVQTFVDALPDTINETLTQDNLAKSNVTSADYLVEQTDDVMVIVPETIDHDEVVETEFNIVSAGKNISNRAKRGFANPETWGRNANKKLRMEGKPYKGICDVDGHKTYSKLRPQRIIGESRCGKRCHKSRQCELMTDNLRREINHSFWNNMNWSEKKFYATALVEQCTPTQTKYSTMDESRRKCTYKYYLKNGEIKVSVCKDMFLSTLGIGEHILYGWMNSLNDHGMPENGKSPSNRHGKESPHVQQAKDFLINLPKMPSHYCRMSTEREYLEPLYKSFTDLYRVYKDHCSTNEIRPVSKMTLLKIFRELNISLFRPKKDQCDLCVAFETNNISESEYKAHIVRKDSARSEKQKDKQRSVDDKNVKVFTMDVQSVLLCPLIQASAVYFKTKLACHNFTTYNMATKDVNCYFWHEGECGLTADSFASCIYDLIEDSIQPDLEEIILFSDGCGYQNRNVTLANTLLHASVKHQVIISQKYLEKGHTQMEVDSVHSSIEQKIRKRAIYSPANYVEKIQEVRPHQPYNVKYLNHGYFKKFSALKYYDTIRPGKRAGDPVVSDIRELRYLPDGTVLYKLKFDDNYTILPEKRNTRKPSAQCLDTVEPLLIAPLKIKKSKFDHLQQLKTCIPQDYHAFYDSLLYD